MKFVLVAFSLVVLFVLYEPTDAGLAIAGGISGNSGTGQDVGVGAAIGVGGDAGSNGIGGNGAGASIGGNRYPERYPPY